MLLNAIGTGLLVGLAIGVVIHATSTFCVWYDHRSEGHDDYESIWDLLLPRIWYDND